MDDTTRSLASANGSSSGSVASTGLAGLVMEAVAELDRQVERGSFFTQAVFQRGFTRLEQVESLLTRLVDVLAAQGVIAPEELGFGLAATGADNGAESPRPEAEGEPVLAEPAEAGIGWPSVAL